MSDIGALGHHHRDTHLIETFTHERNADDATRVTHHEPDLLRRGFLGSEDEVSLVFPVLIIHDHDKFATRHRGNRFFNRCEGHYFLSKSRSRYFAITSASMLTRSPGPRTPRTVTSNVCGIKAISNQSSPTAVTVRLTPSTAIEPFSAT